MTVDAYALAQVLGSIDLHAGVARKVTLTPNALLTLASGRVVLVYVVRGSVHGHPPLAFGCRVSIDDASGRVAIATVDGSARLATGDAFFTLGRQAFALESEEGATFIAVDIELAGTPAQLSTILPEFIAVAAFDALEPAAASLAENMGKISSDNCSLRSGDPVICRMRVTTVLLCVIRAWAENGCAPEGWPRNAEDPFLDRVLKAIHAEPGREWTVELLATVGIMSRSVFAKRFRRAVGRTPASYVRQVRMDVAKRMLSAGSTVSETSRELGYTSDEGFSRAFRRHTGSPPSVW
jgi:AraC-like DNA-binding protein